MISLTIAMQLKEAGAIPGTELEDRLFVVSDMMIDVQKLFGKDMITFNGSVEWSLDYILRADATWLPTESQLRLYLEDHLLAFNQPAFELSKHPNGYLCRINHTGTVHEFEALKAEDAYGQALYFLLQEAQRQHPPDSGPIA
jgi:hypothetical protein